MPTDHHHQSLVACILCVTIAYGGALMLEKEGPYRSLFVAPQVDPTFSGKMPIEFVHVPKSGSSFLSTLVHIPGACENLPINEDDVTDRMNHFKAPPSWKCNSSVLDLERFSHTPIELQPPGGFEEAKGRFMIMVRQPEQRLLSEIYYMTHFREPNEEDFEYYTDTRGGLLTKLLTQSPPHIVGKKPCDFIARAKHVPGVACSGMPPPTRAEVEMAKSRLQTGFSFIGITDQWDLSICLFNTMFNQACRSFQFQNSRPTSGNVSTLYDTTPLKGWRDPYDTEPYEVALQIFEANLKKYDVSESSCESCWREAGLV